jgi:hypothetical protein
VSASSRKVVTIVHHPNTKFYVLAQPPSPKSPSTWPLILASHSL